MSRSLDDLDKDFRTQIESVYTECAVERVLMRPFYTLRPPVEQGGLWRQSRSIEEIREKLDELEAQKCYYLAECIERAGPQSGPEVTKAIPGLSWHQWGEALDSFWLNNNKADWRKPEDGGYGYAVYANVARRFGLTAGGHWQKFKDWPHIQKRKEEVLDLYTLKQVNDIMKERFG